MFRTSIVHLQEALNLAVFGVEVACTCSYWLVASCGSTGYCLNDITITSSATDRHNNSVKEGIDKVLHHYPPGVQEISDCRDRQHKTQTGLWSPIIHTTEPKDESLHTHHKQKITEPLHLLHSAGIRV
jgi:hypothetical protein